MVAHMYETIAHFLGEPLKTRHFCKGIGAQYALTVNKQNLITI